MPAAMNEHTSHPHNHCLSCNATLHGAFCAKCGEKVYHPADKSLKLLIREAITFMTNLDGKVITTVKTIYLRPGQLALDYCRGVRKKYYKPLPFFLAIVVVYLLFPLATGMNMEMRYYRSSPLIGPSIGVQIDKRLAAEGITETALAEQFNQRSSTTSKFLLLLLIPLSLPLLHLLYFYKQRYIFDNFVLLTEINTFFLLTIFLLLPALLFPLNVFFSLQVNDTLYERFTVALFGGYCAVVFHRVFAEKWWLSLLKGGVFSALFLLMIVVVYRYIVFEVTFALL